MGRRHGNRGVAWPDAPFGSPPSLPPSAPSRFLFRLSFSAPSLQRYPDKCVANAHGTCRREGGCLRGVVGKNEHPRSESSVLWCAALRFIQVSLLLPRSLR